MVEDNIDLQKCREIALQVLGPSYDQRFQLALIQNPADLIYKSETGEKLFSSHLKNKNQFFSFVNSLYSHISNLEKDQAKIILEGRVSLMLERYIDTGEIPHEFFEHYLAAKRFIPGVIDFSERDISEKGICFASEKLEKLLEYYKTLTPGIAILIDGANFVSQAASLVNVNFSYSGESYCTENPNTYGFKKELERLIL